VPRDRVERFLERITPYVLKDGARNLNSVSRGLSIPYQTLRGRMDRLKEAEGISIFTVVDASRLGLERARAFFETPEGKTAFDHRAFFKSLHENAGLQSYARCLVSGKFDCEFVIPSGKFSELGKILASLEDTGIIRNAAASRLLWKEVLTMRCDLYNYKKRDWDFDYSRLAGKRHAPAISTVGATKPAERVRYDHHDVMLVKSLELNPWVTSRDLAKVAGVSDADVHYHLTQHVFGRRQIAGFTLKWTGTEEEAKRLIVPITYVFKSLGENLAKQATSIFSSEPFTCNHMLTDDGTYVAELLVPARFLVETFEYISSRLRHLDMRPDDLLFPDRASSQRYTIPYRLLDRDRKGWHLDAGRATGRIVETVAPLPKSGARR
jgi:hypothetical protein